MLKRDELYIDKNKPKILLIFTLFFVTFAIGYLVYNICKNSNYSIKGTKVLGVSYIPKDKNKKEDLTKNSIVEYNKKSNISNVDDKDKYEDVVLVDDKGEYRDVTVVDNRDKGQTKTVTVKNSI